MPQVNMTIDDERYAILVREVGRRMTASGKILKLSTLAAELLNPAIDNLNGQTPTQDSEQVDKPADEPLNNPLADLDI